MLIESPLKNGDVVTLKLTTNEEVIGSLVDDTEKHVIVNKPMTAIIHDGGIGMIPFVMTVDPDAKIKINKNNVLVFEKTAKPIADEYTRSTSKLAI